MAAAVRYQDPDIGPIVLRNGPHSYLIRQPSEGTWSIDESHEGQSIVESAVFILVQAIALLVLVRVGVIS